MTLLGELHDLSWDFICFSETRRLSSDVIIAGGHRLISSLSAPMASGTSILMHKRFDKSVLKVHIVSDRVMAVDLKFGGKRIRLISVYVPYSGYPWEQFISVMDDLSSLCMQGQDHGMHLIIGGDFNLCLGVGARGQVFGDLCYSFSLIVANGAGLDSTASNWTKRGTDGALRRIDFILHSTGLDSLSASACNDIDLGSDHRCVKASIRLSRPQKQLRGNLRKKGWIPHLDREGAPSQFHHRLDSLLLLDPDQPMTSISNITYEAAQSGGDVDKGPSGLRRPEKSQELIDLIHARKSTTSPIERRNVRIQSKDTHEWN